MVEGKINIMNRLRGIAKAGIHIKNSLIFILRLNECGRVSVVCVCVWEKGAKISTNFIFCVKIPKKQTQNSLKWKTFKTAEENIFLNTTRTPAIQISKESHTQNQKKNNR